MNDHYSVTTRSWRTRTCSDLAEAKQIAESLFVQQGFCEYDPVCVTQGDSVIGWYDIHGWSDRISEFDAITERLAKRMEARS